MKIKLSAIVLLSVLFFTQCDKTEVDKSSITINDTEFPLKYGFIEDEGTGPSVGTPSYRKYYIKFTDQNDYTPKTYLYFAIKSTSTTRLEEGIYQFNPYYDEGEFGYVNFGYNLVYDSGDNVTDGTRFSGDATSGTITVSKDSETGNYVFDFEIVAEYDQETYTISGHTNLSLTEAYIK